MKKSGNGEKMRNGHKKREKKSTTRCDKTAKTSKQPEEKSIKQKRRSAKWQAATYNNNNKCEGRKENGLGRGRNAEGKYNKKATRKGIQIIQKK